MKIGYRTRSGERVATEWSDGTVTVKTFGLNGSVRTQVFTEAEFEDVVLQHDLCRIGEERDGPV